MQAQTMDKIQKHHGHHANSAMRAANMAPAVAPVGPAAPKHANTVFRFTPTGKFLPISAMAFGTRSAGPIPWNALHIPKSMTPDLYEKPEINDQRENQAQPSKNTLL
jgi:hypothetical protein